MCTACTWHVKRQEHAASGSSERLADCAKLLCKMYTRHADGKDVRLLIALPLALTTHERVQIVFDACHLGMLVVLRPDQVDFGKAPR